MADTYVSAEDCEKTLTVMAARERRWRWRKRKVKGTWMIITITPKHMYLCNKTTKVRYKIYNCAIRQQRYDTRYITVQ